MAEVETQGTGEIERIADRAGLEVLYTEEAKVRVTAVSALAERIRTVESLLERDGVEVRARRLFVHDRWDAKRRAGASANQSYSVRVTDLEVLNDLVADLVLTEPANLRGPFWDLADHADAVRAAQYEAVADARRRAEGYADALGTRLGPLVRLSDGRITPQPARFASLSHAREKATAARPDIADLSLEPQLVTVVTSCTTVWQLADQARRP
ncbi:SIMPL domain-containing protein [Amycolatopsis sp. GM8]|uniref:SIMPL domain-containing protein n=1 Tax=Amycolatopsis sp. GM8 TaxID=2896530 RepID=UPI001F2A923A|nr:SIMPL domain-containing protein [Amycolatopsis sp. GM8]